MIRYDNQTIMLLKARFFDFLETDSDYRQLIDKMVDTLKEVLELEEVTYYAAENWRDGLVLEATTYVGQTRKTPILSLRDTFYSLGSERVVAHPDIPNFYDYTILLSLVKADKKYGLICLKHRENGDLSLEAAQYEEVIDVCISFIEKIKDLNKIVLEETRYKQLFRVNEKFHSTMDMDLVLGEIIFTLKEMYPSFSYYLMLSHDSDTHTELPIKDLEYDSDNIVAMEAYVTGSIQLEVSTQARDSILYAPLKGKQGVYGVLQVIAYDTVEFPETEVEFVKLLANTAGSALENAQLYQQSKRLVADLQLINETSHRLNSNLRLSETMGYMTDQIMTSFDAEEVCFAQVSEDLLQVQLLEGSTPLFSKGEARHYTDYVTHHFKQNQEAIFIGDLPMTKQGLEKPYRSMMAVPMVQSGLMKGFALVLHSQPYHFSFDNFKLLQSLIHHSTLAFTNSMLREELEKMVVTDHLTKLFSRSYLDRKVTESLTKDHQGTFLLIDIDNFKSVNDTFGHQIGDEILIQVANIIKGNIREGDIGARWGGEELAIYLPLIPLELGLTVANRLVEKVRKHSNPQITISCGVSFWNNEQHEPFHQLFKRADQALYRAKGTGKNRVVYA